ncbi:hypothetical protein vseg_003999 [Gypsophila vaccaria]
MYYEKHDCSIYCQDCSLKRQKKNGKSSIVSSFSKTMLGKTYDVAMVVPPAVSKKIELMVGKKVILEDYNSQKWSVHMSSSGGYLAFEMGWRNFVQGNGIQLGDFLEFNYSGDSLFLVNIYGRNGCQKILPSFRIKKNRAAETATSFIPKKRRYDSFYEQSARNRHSSTSAFPRSNIDVTPRRKKDRNVPFGMARNVPSQCNIHRTPKVVPVSKTLEDPCFMTSWQTKFDVEDDRDRLLDLSAFEMRGKKPTIDGEKDLPEMETDGIGSAKHHLHDKSSSLVSDESGAASTDLQTSPIPERNNGFSGQSGGSRRPVKQEATEWKRHISGGVMADSYLGNKRPGCELIKLYCVKGCCKNSSPTVKNEAVVKPEPMDSDAPSAVEVQVALDSEDFLVLSEPLPNVSLSRKTNHKKQTHAPVYLRDPAQRLWPVVHHFKNGVSVLASGWKEVMKANDIQPGDKCLFVVENSEESIFTLQVVHN